MGAAHIAHSLLYLLSPKPHLYGLLQDAALEAMEDVDGPSVAVL